jgi:hypothetical protein
VYGRRINYKKGRYGNRGAGEKELRLIVIAPKLQSELYESSAS